MPKRMNASAYTVAGDACLNESTSKRTEVFAVNVIASPELKHNFRLSSRTVFIFSIHSESIGPSNTIHLWHLFADDSKNLRNAFEISPSVQSMLIESYSPNSCFVVTDLAFMYSGTKIFPLNSSINPKHIRYAPISMPFSGFSFDALIAFAKMRKMVDLPVYGAPININACLVANVSCVSINFPYNRSIGCNF